MQPRCRPNMGLDQVMEWLQQLGHRANLINPDVNTVGIGVVADETDGRRAYVATQVFLRFAREIDVGAAPQRLLEMMNRARTARGARPLSTEPNLESAAQEAASAYFTDPSLSTHRPANPAVPEHTGAGAFLGAFERQFDGDSPVVSGGTSWPTCQDVRGKNGSRRCNRPALYLGEGQWSLSCDKHARRTDREHHERWGDTRRTSLDYDCCQRTRQRQAIGRAVLDWWRETGGPLTAIRSAVDHAGTQD
jgi:hypothetical protein